MRLAGDRDVLERTHLARRFDLTVKVAKALANDVDPRVRIELAACTDHKSIWQKLKKDSNPKVRKSAKNNKNFKWF